MKADLEQKNRDPESFTFGLWPGCVIDDGTEDLDAMLDHPLSKWFAAVWGRLQHGAWQDEGLPLIFDATWHYAMRYRPFELSDAEVERVLAETTRAHVEAAFIIGSVDEIADELASLVEGGANYIAPLDLSGMFLPQNRQEAVVKRQISLCTELKSRFAETPAAV
jgi:phthiodiolone/phenolphthiodiolone dimycocerosates ketoreductase